MTDAVICQTCGKPHPLEEIELVFNLPDAIFELSELERSERCDVSSDICAIDRNRFFLRGLLPIPVRGRAEPHRIGLWAELDKETFDRVYRLWDEPSQVNEPLLAAVMANNVPLVPPTLGMDIDMRLTGPTTRPEFFLRDANHALAAEQRSGVDSHRALEYAERSASTSTN